MTLDPTRRPDPTDPRAGVDTLVSNTSQGGGTVGVDGALGLTLNVRVALEARETGTGGGSVPVGTLSIDTTGRGTAGINDLWCRGYRRKIVKKIFCFCVNLTCLSVTAGEWISNIALVTNTQRDVVSDPAVSIDSTESRTGILTLSVDACFVLRTFRVDNTFRSAVWRAPNHLGQTSAVTRTAEVPGRIAVWTAGVRITGILYYDWCDG